MLTGVHLLLTYRCTYECDHCFVFGGPNADGVFTLGQLRRILDQAAGLESVREIYFEGGEAFLYDPLLLEGVRLAREKGFDAGIVTNGYFATTVEDAVLWLEPFVRLGICDLSVSDDAFHSDADDSPAKRALEAAKRLGLPAATICIEKPAAAAPSEGGRRGAPVVGGDVRFRGRAAERLTDGLPTRPWETFVECPHEDLANPQRVHVDCYGNVHLCQGISMGNCWRTPLAKLVAAYRPERHPIAGALIEGGPAMLVTRYGVPHADGYVDACHLCYRVRQALIGRFPEILAPPQIYGR